MKKLFIATIIALIGSTNVDASTTRTTIAMECVGGKAAITTDGSLTAYAGFGDLLVTNFKDGGKSINFKGDDFIIVGVDDGVNHVDVGYKPSDKKIAILVINDNKQFCNITKIESKKE